MASVRLEEFFNESILGFFRESGHPHANVSRVNEIVLDLNDTILASIGLACTELKGNIQLTTNVDGLRATHPMVALGAPVSDTDLLDWSGEILNQILGRFKNHLLSLGLNTQMSLPVVVSGQNMNVPSNLPKEAIVKIVEFEGRWKFKIALRIDFDRSFSAEALDAREILVNVSKKEGDSFLF